MCDIKAHPTPESVGMVAVTRDEFHAWLRETTSNIVCNAHHDPLLEGKVWSSYSLNGCVIARTYSDYIGRTVLYMMRPEHAASARAFHANPKLMPYWATYRGNNVGISFRAHSSKEALAIAGNHFEVDTNDTALVLHGDPKRCYSCNGIEFIEI